MEKELQPEEEPQAGQEFLNEEEHGGAVNEEQTPEETNDESYSGDASQFILDVSPHQSVFENKVALPQLIFGAAFLGGPLAAAYLMAKNFKTLGKPKAATVTWVLSSLFFAALMSIMLTYDDEERLVPMISALAYCLIYLWLAQWLQGKEIAAFQEKGGELLSGWYAFFTGVLGLVASFVLVYAAIVVILAMS